MWVPSPAGRPDIGGLLVIKTTADRYNALESRVRELHTYDEAEVIALRIEQGAPDYLAWWVTEMCHRP